LSFFAKSKKKERVLVSNQTFRSCPIPKEEREAGKEEPYPSKPHSQRREYQRRAATSLARIQLIPIHFTQITCIGFENPSQV
jgi:hypothetical protein